MTFLDNLKEETTIGTTENGAKTFTSSLNANLDFFGQAGAMRSRTEDVGRLFLHAYSEDKELALRNLVHLRNIRLGGLGERDAFRVAFNSLMDTDAEVAAKFLNFTAFIGRWDDVVYAYEYASNTGNKKVKEAALDIISYQLSSDCDKVVEGDSSISLLAKWVPSTSVKSPKRKKVANMLAKDLGYGNNHKDYRKVLAVLRTQLGLVEKDLANKEYYKIDFTKLPSKALFKYRKAFLRHMPERYEEFIEKVNSGEIKLNAKNLLPYEIVRAYRTDDWGTTVKELDNTLEASWKSLEDYIGDTEENVIVVSDVSGSMTGDPMHVSVSLGLYSAERLKGAFKDHFITFSASPTLINVPSDWTLRDRIDKTMQADWGMNTNLQATFDLILDTAVKNNTPQEDLPSKLLIVSDMEYDTCTGRNISYYFGEPEVNKPNFEVAKDKFEAKGYKLPEVVFWNVASRNDNIPVRFNEEGVALVSGLTPTIFTSVLGSKITSPEAMMIETLKKEEYDFVTTCIE